MLCTQSVVVMFKPLACSPGYDGNTLGVAWVGTCTPASPTPAPAGAETVSTATIALAASTGVLGLLLAITIGLLVASKRGSSHKPGAGGVAVGNPLAVVELTKLSPKAPRAAHAAAAPSASAFAAEAGGLPGQPHVNDWQER